MTREDIIRMAREAGLYLATDVHWMPIIGLDYAEKFAAVVAAHALIEPCCGNYAQCQKVCMPRAAAAEREACAQMCERDDSMRWAGAAEAIRTRGNK